MIYKINYTGGSSSSNSNFQIKNNFEIADVNFETFKILFNIFNEKNLGQQNCGIIPYYDYIIK